MPTPAALPPTPPLDECPSCRALGLCRAHEAQLQAEADYHASYSLQTCGQCGGDGVVETQLGRYGDGESVMVRCRWCHGTGEVAP